MEKGRDGKLPPELTEDISEMGIALAALRKVATAHLTITKTVEPVNMRWGDGVLALSCLIWLSISVGPWWIGLGIFVLSFILNILQFVYFRRTRRAAEHMMKQAADLTARLKRTLRG